MLVFTRTTRCGETAPPMSRAFITLPPLHACILDLKRVSVSGSEGHHPPIPHIQCMHLATRQEGGGSDRRFLELGGLD